MLTHSILKGTRESYFLEKRSYQYLEREKKHCQSKVETKL